MGTISVPQLTDGTTHTAADHNNQANTIANEFNGNIDNANIKAGAAIATSKLAQDNGSVAIKPIIAYKFSAYRSAAFSLPGAGATTKIPFDTKEYDTGTNFDIVTNIGRFTAPVAGFYNFSTLISVLTAGSWVYNVQLFKNGSTFKTLQQTKTNAANTGIGGSVDVQAAANDYFEIFAFNNDAGADNLNVGAAGVWFTGKLVSV